MGNKNRLTLSHFSGFTLIEIIVVLLITSILLFLTTNFLQNIQKISIRTDLEGENIKEIILFKTILSQDLNSFIPTNTISESTAIISNGKKLQFSSVFLGLDEEEQARDVIWEIKDQSIIRQTNSNLQLNDFIITHTFEKLGKELIFEMFYEKQWYRDYAPTKLFFRPESVILRQSENNILMVVNVR